MMNCILSDMACAREHFTAMSHIGLDCMNYIERQTTHKICALLFYEDVTSIIVQIHLKIQVYYYWSKATLTSNCSSE